MLNAFANGHLLCSGCWRKIGIGWSGLETCLPNLGLSGRLSNATVDLPAKPAAGFNEDFEVLAGTAVVGDGYPDRIAAIQYSIGGCGDSPFLDSLEEFLVECI